MNQSVFSLHEQAKQRIFLEILYCGVCISDILRHFFYIQYLCTFLHNFQLFIWNMADFSIAFSYFVEYIRFSNHFQLFVGIYQNFPIFLAIFLEYFRFITISSYFFQRIKCFHHIQPIFEINQYSVHFSSFPRLLLPWAIEIYYFPQELSNT